MTKTLRFYKDQDGWFVDLPEYPGPKEDLAMVLGADDMCDIISKYTDEVTIRISDELTRTKDLQVLLAVIVPEVLEQLGGQWYVWHGKLQNRAVWLCDVTKFVFGEFPNTIYFEIV